MSIPRPSGLKAPGSKIGRPSGLPAPTQQPRTGIPPPSGASSKTQSAIAKSARGAGFGQPSAERYASEAAASARGPESDTSSLPTDDFRIGDRVWVSGIKPGIIAFIGETQFAPGEWAGVVLDEPQGKNDGSVMGVRYFQCEMKRGVFSRLTKLSRSPQGNDSASDSASTHSAHASNSSVAQNKQNNGIPAVMSSSMTSPSPRPTTPRLGLGGSHAPSSSSTSLHKANSPSPNSMMHAAAARAGLKIGDRVLVSGSKAGVLKYVGETDFAKGNWAGVELDEALGKNDGAVAGKRYFDCKALHGLFAPVHKVTRLGNSMSLSTPSPMSRSLGPGLRSSRERSGSQESVSSISSSASSVSRSRTNKVGQRPSTLNLSATTTALQKALKEKEEHIEQLLRERDLERSEVARAAAQVDEAEGQLTTMKSEQERFRGDAEELIARLRGQIDELEKEKEVLVTKLQDEQRRVDDLQFQIEEETISKDDLESNKEQDDMRYRELERNYDREKTRADNLETELNDLKSDMVAHEDRLKEQNKTQTEYLDQIDELTHKLSQAENRIKQFESSRLEDGAKSSQVSVELEEKAHVISELEEKVSSHRRELKHSQDKLQEVQEQLTGSNNRCKKLQESVDALTNRMQALEADHSKVNDELRAAKSHSSDLQRQLTASKEKSAELLDDREKLEQQIAEVMKNSGDSSNQLSALNDQLAEKTSSYRRVGELQNDLSSSSQQIAKLNESIEDIHRVHKKERDDIVYKFEDQLKSLQSQVEDTQAELDKSHSKLSKVTEEGERERKEEVGRKEGEIQQLKQKLTTQTEELSQQQVQTQAHKEYLDKITLELEAMKYEKEKAEKCVKRVEGERDKMNTELIQAKVELTKIQSQSQDHTKQQAQLQEKVDDLLEEKDRLLRSKQEVEKQREDLRAEKDKAGADRDRVQQDWVTLQAALQKRDIETDHMKAEHALQIERLRKQTEENQERLMEKSQTEADMLNEELEGHRKTVAEARQSLQDKEAEVSALKADLQHYTQLAQDKKQLEDQNECLAKDLQELRDSHRVELATVEADCVSLGSKLKDCDQLLQQQQQLIDQQQTQLASLEAEKEELAAVKVSLEDKQVNQERERKVLMEKVDRLETSVAQASAVSVNMGSGDSPQAKLLQDKLNVEQQVEFLNSVIVDLESKNQQLTQKLEAMESLPLNGNEGTSPPSASQGVSRPRPPPRLFCDICDEFDLHDTDDCPTQSMSDGLPPSSHHGDRNSVRPYCEICEAFGHWTDDCEDEETY